MIKAVLFDLDGTLLPMENDQFTKGYFGLLAKKLAPIGYDAKSLVGAIMASLQAMVKNEDERTNEEVFWECFTSILGKHTKNDIPVFEDFYNNEFDGAKAFCGFNQEAKESVEKIKEMGLRVALATNPIFPAIATQKRIGWAGFNEDDFEFYTTYENSCHCKPSLSYYKEVCFKLGLEAQECLMVGNDVQEDMIASKLGMKVFLLTDTMINRDNSDISTLPHGSYQELLNYINEIK